MSRRISLENLESYVTGLEASGEWESQFHELGDPTTQLKDMNVARLPENINKHRYPADNLGAYDESRVVLSQSSEDSSSDYINANWIDGYGGSRSYIVTQAPLSTTIIDFYRMIWENNVHQVVMLASLHDIEVGKCTAYYPEESATFGEIQVTLERKIYQEDIVRRIYAMKQGKLVRVLVHYHFTCWPDQGVPEEPNQILELMQCYRRSDTFLKDWPLVVHCSAGVGRTGSFLLAEIVFDMAEIEGSVDFLKQLRLLRNQRISMVEKPEQYFFAHKIVLLALVKGLFKNGVEFH